VKSEFTEKASTRLPVRRSVRRRAWHTLAALTVVIAVVGGGAYAAIDPVGPDGDIDACFEKRSGDLDLLKGRKCGKGERPVSWGAAGPPGPAGSAIAYGRVAPDGSVSASKNLAVDGRGNSQDIPVYCLNHTAGGATSVQVTVDAAAADPLITQAAATTDPGKLAEVGCPATSDFVVTMDSTVGNDRGIDAGFYVAVIA